MENHCKILYFTYFFLERKGKGEVENERGKIEIEKGDDGHANLINLLKILSDLNQAALNINHTTEQSQKRLLDTPPNH